VCVQVKLFKQSSQLIAKGAALRQAYTDECDLWERSVCGEVGLCDAPGAGGLWERSVGGAAGLWARS